MQTEIIHSANTQYRHRREGRADAVHERAARRTEVVGHGRVWPNRGDSIGPALEVLAAAHVFQILVVDGEVGSEHGRGELAAINTVADESVDQARSFGRLVAVVRTELVDDAKG